MIILVTGFDPFGGETVNPAFEAVKRLPDSINNAQIIKLEIPTILHQSLDCIETAIMRFNPDVILSVGQAAGRSSLTVERIGINIDDARIPDNAGNQPIDEPIFTGGPDAYFVNLPIKAMIQAIRDAGIPASISNSAGTYVCNHVIYGVRHMIETKYPGKKSGFIHVPLLPQQALSRPDFPTMSVESIVTGLTAAIDAITRYTQDIPQSEGTDV